MFLEHDDLYKGGGHQYLVFGPKLVDPPEDCLSNHQVICGLAERLGAAHPGFAMSEREHIDWMLANSGWGSLAELEQNRWIDCQPPFDEAHYRTGFAWPDGKFRFSPDWQALAAPNRPADGPLGPWREMPELPDHWAVTEDTTETFPFRLVTAPAPSYLNSTFNQTPSSIKREIRPSVLIHPDDADEWGLPDGSLINLVNKRGQTSVYTKKFSGVQRGVLIAEGLWPNAAHGDGWGINALTGADAVAPFGGAAFHDNHVRIERAE